MATIADLERAVIRLVTDAPFYGHVAVALRKQMTAGPRTIAADGHAVVMRFGEEEWRELSPEQRTGALKHELLHLALGHPFMRRDFGDKERFDVAADLVVSQLLDRDELAPTDYRLSDFADLGLLPDQGVAYYYARLETEQAKGGGGGSASEAGGESGEEKRRTAHSAWETIDEAPGFARTLMETAMESLVTDLAGRSASWGSLPRAIEWRVRELLGKRPSLDWRRVLRLFSATARSTQLLDTIHRASRRYGTTPGTKIRPRRALAVVLDTSGSVSETDLAAFLSEVRHIHRAGAEVTIVCADAAVSSVIPYHGQAVSRLGGGGGTCFDPAIDYANVRLRPDGLVYLTDGLAPAPRVKPRFPTLWLLTRGGARADDPNVQALPGRRVWMS